MPTWIKTKREETEINQQYDVDINSLSEMQHLAYDVVQLCFQDNTEDQEPLCRIIIRVQGKTT